MASETTQHPETAWSESGRQATRCPALARRAFYRECKAMHKSLRRGGSPCTLREVVAANAARLWPRTPAKGGA